MKLWSKIFLTILAVFLLPAVFAQTINVTSIRLSTVDDCTRLVFDLSGKIASEIKSTEKQITVIMQQVKLSADFGRLNLEQTPITSLEHKYHDDLLEITIALKSPAKVKHFSLSSPERLVIDISPLDNSHDETVEAIDKIERLLMERVYKNEGVADLGKSMKQIITVVIDPGHGGKDCGAIGVGGIYEKDIVLAISRKLQRMVNSTPGFRAILTRSGDYFIPLRKRLKIARKNSADMFISIHADAYKKKEARGFSIFVLSQRGATSEAARWLAEKENISELDQDLVDKNRLLKSVLLDLSQTATVNTSLDIGAEIIRSVSKIATLHSPRVEQAGFVVLKSPHIPSMLVEIGFLSNGVEAKLLAKDFYQNSIAEEIAAGIRSYFAGHRAN